MTDLTGERCSVCRPDSPRVTEEEIAELHPLVPDWEIVDVEKTPRLRRTFRFRTYRGTLAFVQRVGELAEEEGHHPTMTVDWGKVRVSWWTHAIKWLTRNDFIMAAKTDAVYGELTTGDTQQG
jgi:4a-hydroxytetrahydrobiopterin dehydratase